MVTPGRMSRRRLVAQLDLAQIEAAIHDAERRTSGELRVSVAPPFWGDVGKAAARAFERLGMANTRQRNAVLFFVVPSRRKFAVLGDAGIHARVGQAFWDRLTAAMTARFHAGDFTGGLVDAIGAVADELAKHYPWVPGDLDELPNAVDSTPA